MFWRKILQSDPLKQAKIMGGCEVNSFKTTKTQRSKTYTKLTMSKCSKLHFRVKDHFSDPYKMLPIIAESFLYEKNYKKK